MSDPNFDLPTALASAIATTTISQISATYSAIIPTPTDGTSQLVPLGGSAGAIQPSEDLLCDWIRAASDCRDANFIRSLLITSSVMHGLVFLFGLWLLTYRNRGFNSKIVTDLFITVGTGVRPKPMDCIIFFTGLASLIKVGVNIPLILDVFKDMIWVRIIIEQTYWIVVAIGFSSYFVGLLYAMPVTTREGIFAVYHPETAFGTRPLPPIHVLTPTTVQKNFLLVMGAVYPAIFASAPGVLSALFSQKPGYENLSRILLITQYSQWVLILWAMAIMFFYYGLKYTFILRANIIIAEAALKAPNAAFGISNLRSSSPARFLFIQLQITGFGGAAVTLLAGSLCMIWVLCRDKILAMKEDELPHTMAFFWTCAIAVLYFLFMVLIAVQSVRNRRRGMHEPSSSVSNSFVPHGSQKNSSGSKSLFSSQAHKVRAESETGLAQRSSAELSTLHSVNSIKKDSYEVNSLDLPEGRFDESAAFEAMIEASYRMDHDVFNVSHNANKMEKDRTAKVSLGSPSRPFVIKSHLSGESFESSATFGRRRSEDGSVQSSNITQNNNIVWANGVNPDIRQTVFGGRSSKTGGPLPLFSSSTPTSPSFPLTTMGSSSRESRSVQSSHTSSQVSNSSSLNTAISGSYTTSNGTAYVTIPEDSGMPNYESRGRGGRSENKKEYGQSMPHMEAGKGLSPPPRTYRPYTNDG
ncbi:hypothetical protein BGX27_008667 [Mortierella sp. AM989]|nr:hypothetical protein BGX27_008667 [Mortierella sp. AM989]